MYGKALAAEVFGTFWLVLGGCGSAILAAMFMAGDSTVNLGLGFMGVGLAFGLTVVTGAYAVGHVSGGHFNPAVTLGLVAGGRFSIAKAPGYIIAQVIGGTLGGAAIYYIASGQAGFAITPGAGTFATNGFGVDGSPGGYSMQAAFLTEVIMTAVFLIVIMGATSKRASAAMGGLTIGLSLALIHFISIPVTNTSVNPARSPAQALIANVFGEGVTLPMQQLWLFWAAPIIGAVIGAVIYRVLMDANHDVEVEDKKVFRTDAGEATSRAAMADLERSRAAQEEVR
ncbi:aquaporin Z [Granulosicoccus antarcticus]|uniref:Aquaporin Z n=1 Tax=Granulosicoccus antarcticus IMCC3135 TaxID=1192854 RepID=A0A2Z2NQM5_9GAMM|nr:aquaporin Z [Granulosicoccus antarcticus]ASJ73776.1 Aquaporin Z [Granulosicoccus antarcticus IMCC3135]